MHETWHLDPRLLHHALAPHKARRLSWEWEFAACNESKGHPNNDSALSLES